MAVLVVAAFFLGRATAYPEEPQEVLSGPIELGVEYPTWQKLAYVSTLCRRMAQEVHALEELGLAKGEKIFIQTAGADTVAGWYAPDPCELSPFPPCETTIRQTAACEELTWPVVESIFLESRLGINNALDKLGPNTTYKYQGIRVQMPNEKWLEPRKREAIFEDE